jgi:hypothetical protein
LENDILGQKVINLDFSTTIVVKFGGKNDMSSASIEQVSLTSVFFKKNYGQTPCHLPLNNNNKKKLS